MGNAEEAFNHYKKVFKTEFAGPLMRMKDSPPREGAPALAESEKNKVMHVALPILGGTMIMATDMLESMGHKLVEGNNFTISLSPDTNAEADRLYKELSVGGTDGVAPHDEFWGYWGTCNDRFGIRWMFNVMKQPK
jgi:PhnB protein